MEVGLSKGSLSGLGPHVLGEGANDVALPKSVIAREAAREDGKLTAGP